MKSIFVTPYTYEWIEPFNHSTTGPSMTVPDDAYSIEELFDRLDRGLSLGSPAPSIYDEEFESIDDYASSDIPEPDEFYDSSMRKIDRLTYVSNIIDDYEKEKTNSKKNDRTTKNDRGYEGRTKDQVSDSRRSLGGDSESQSSSDCNEV